MSRYTLAMIVISVVALVAWLGTNAFHDETLALQLPNKLEEAKEPVDSQFDNEVLKMVKEKVDKSIKTQGETVSRSIAENTPSPSSTPEPLVNGVSTTASDTGQLVATPAATQRVRP